MTRVLRTARTTAARVANGIPTAVPAAARAIVMALLVPAVATAQATGMSPLLRGVPAGSLSATPLALSLEEAVRRGLAQNLDVVLQEQRRLQAEGVRQSALSQVLPHISGSMRQSRQVLSTAAFGFTLPDLPIVIGPFGVFDARVSLSTPLIDARVIGGLRSAGASLEAGRADVLEVREAVVLAVGSMYLLAQADAARVESARAQVTTAEALVQLTVDQRTAGVVAGIDVVRQQVQLQSARARLITVSNTFDKRKLALARAIGLPAGQAFTLTESTAFRPTAEVTVEQAVMEATLHREDLKAARARLEAARAERQATAAGVLPSLHLDADIGVIGPRASDVARTYAVAAVVRVPIFEGGATRARVLQADAAVRAREAELADVAGGLRFDVETAVLDIRAAEAGVGVADSARALSGQELNLAQDRFRAGVSSTLELVQAQERVASATEQYIASVYEHTVAKASLARAIGQVEARFVALVRGEP